MKKRYIVLAILGVELLSLPAAAKIISQVDFNTGPNIISADIESPKGISRHFLISDGPFVITSADMISDIETSVFVAGKIGDVEFGANAHSPGPLANCSTITSSQEQIIYTSHRGTIAKSVGADEAVSEAVLIMIRHNKSETPTIKFKSIPETDELEIAHPCYI